MECCSFLQARRSRSPTSRKSKKKAADTPTMAPPFCKEQNCKRVRTVTAPLAHLPLLKLPASSALGVDGSPSHQLEPLDARDGHVFSVEHRAEGPDPAVGRRRVPPAGYRKTDLRTASRQRGLHREKGSKGQ
eukprot:762820-Hanusia_phi.AAC.1